MIKIKKEVVMSGIKMALHHVFLQLFILKDEDNIIAVKEDLYRMGVSSIGIDVDLICNQALIDNLSGDYDSLVKHAYLFDTQASIQDLVRLLDTELAN